MGGFFSSLGGSGMGTQSEWDNFDNAGFDTISNEGVSTDWGKLLGAQGGGAGGGSGKNAAMQMGLSAGNKYQDMGQYANANSLMGMLGSAQNLDRNSNIRNKDDPFNQFQGDPYLMQMLQQWGR